MSRSATSMLTRWRAQSADLHKYLTPHVGGRLARYDQDRIGVDARLPEHYQQYHNLWRKQPLKFINLREPENKRFKKDEFGNVVVDRLPNVHAIYPDEFHNGLWGGEGVIKGYNAPPPVKHPPQTEKPLPKYWFPKLHHTAVYSEILNVHLTMLATERGENVVDEHHGLDFYLLETPVNEVYAKKLLLLKREMLLRLATEENLYPNDAGKRKEVMDKYKHLSLPLEEATWHGLTLDMARQRQLALERREDALNATPRRIQYQKELVELLQGGYLDDLDPQLLYDEEKEASSGGLTDKLKELGSKLGIK